MSVRKLLRDCQSKEWLTVDGSFSKVASQAMNVESFVSVSRLSRQFPGRRFELVLKFPNGEEICLPID
jgi:hypothetical protein